MRVQISSAVIEIPASGDLFIKSYKKKRYYLLLGRTMQFEQFRPSKKILEQICKDEEDLETIYYIVPYRDGTERIKVSLDDMICSTITGLSYIVASYYRWALDIQANMDTQSMGMLILEPLRNALDHGSKEGDAVTIGLFLGPEGICLGFKDQGDYFKSEEIKTLFESRTLPEKRGEKQSYLSGAGLGVGITYKSADIIEVDTEKGILYCVKFKKNLAKNEKCMKNRPEYKPRIKES